MGAGQGSSGHPNERSPALTELITLQSIPVDLHCPSTREFLRHSRALSDSLCNDLPIIIEPCSFVSKPNKIARRWRRTRSSDSDPPAHKLQHVSHRHRRAQRPLEEGFTGTPFFFPLQEERHEFIPPVEGAVELGFGGKLGEGRKTLEEVVGSEMGVEEGDAGEGGEGRGHSETDSLRVSEGRVGGAEVVFGL